MTRRRRSACCLTVCWFLAALASPLAIGAAGVSADLVLKGGTVVDGTGAPARSADVAVRDGRIVAVGRFEIEPGTEVIDATGLVVAPGFIDLHTHSDRSILQDPTRANRNYQAQGVTTIVTGNCGGGPIDVAAYLDAIDENGAGTNVIHLVPHGAVRAEVIGNADRRASPDELDRMAEIVRRGMEAGAWGMSTGLIYIPSRYGDTDELIALARVVAEHGGIYASHIRGEGTGLLDSIDEALRIGREAGVPAHISHLKASGKDAWGLVGPACDRIAEARAAGQRASADQYPYVASSTSLGAMVVPDWALRDGDEAFAEIADDPRRGEELREEIRAGLVRRNGGEAIRIARYPKRTDWVGKSVAAIAQEEGMPPEEIVVEIQRNGGASAISFIMSEQDVRHVMARDFVATASDGSAHFPGGDDRPHPRSYGTFPRKIRYALDDGVISLEAAIRSSSGLPAEILGLPDRGTIREGAVADLVVFDPDAFRDAATFDDPTVLAPGVVHLLIAGTPAISGGRFMDTLPGRALRLQSDGPADLIVSASRIWTGDPELPWAEAVACRAGEIVAVGSIDDIARYRGPNTRIVDRPEGFAMPGLIDAHGHLLMLGSSIEEVDLRDVAALDEVGRLIRERAESLPEGAWVTGRNWDQSLWPGGEFPTAAILDEASPDHPVWLRRVDGHAGWANSEAMRLAGVTAGSEAPSDGQIIRDDNGNPTGVFIDGAMGLVGRVVPELSADDVRRRLLLAQDAVLAVGLTGVHDAGVPAGVAAAFRQLDRDGLLKLRVYGMANPPDGRELEFVSRPPEASDPDARFRLQAIKLFIDGAMGSRGALMFEPYADDPENSGLYLIEPDLLLEVTTAALRNGWQVCTHAIGDKGNALVLDAYEAALQAVPEADDARLRVEHAQVVRPQDVPRFARLGIIASMQPAHASTDMRWADDRLGPSRVLGAYAWRWFRDAGVRLAFGSDFPVEIPSPFWGLYASVSRQDARGLPDGGWHPEHLLSLHEALRGFTSGSAFSAFDEQRLGLLRPGYRADLTVIDRDPFASSPQEIREAEVTETIIDGEVVFSGDSPR
ncbi:metal-dependent hydrolase [Tautonia sociabilis]|uniref:Metal-dependent hydrolase n=2 Tax=Tautonia sociabilis TaxID=2080755 RepID=A0A432MHQ1_9BACT|nr:metal-dependent hydrolase [Tautonia sociabilis]